MPLAADLSLTGLGDVIGYAKCEVSIVLDGDKLHRHICATHAHLQQATPTCIACIDSETPRILQTLDEALRSIWFRPDTLDFKWTPRDVLVCKSEVHCIYSRLGGNIGNLYKADNVII
jgi:hypothetical protein